MSTDRFLLRPWLALLAAACAPALGAPGAARSPDQADMDRVARREAAVVLLRVTATIDGKRVDLARAYDGNRLPRFYLASLDGLDAPKRVSPATPARASAEDDWRYLVLSPGTYFLLVLPPGAEQNPPAVAYSAQQGRYGRLTRYELKPGRGAFYSSELGYVFAGSPPPDFQPLSGFWFEVPREREIVYVGSLSLTCTAGRGLFGSLIDSCEDFAIADESRTAGEVASVAFPGLALETRGLVPYGGRRAGTGASVPEALPVISSGPSAVGAAFTGARLAPSGVIYGVDQAVGVFNLLVVGGQLLQQSSENRAAEQRAATMQLCLERLSATVQGADPAAAFASALRAAAQAGQQPAGDAAAAGDGAPTAPQQRWSVAVPILRLREAGQPESLALELGLALRLEDVATGRLEGYELLLSGPDLPLQSPHTPASPLYAKFVPERAAPRPREEWCGPDGGSLLSAEITQALRNIAAQAARDFK